MHTSNWTYAKLVVGCYLATKEKLQTTGEVWVIVVQFNDETGHGPTK